MADLAPASSTRCLNCGADLMGPYCHQCGQRDQPPDLPLVDLLREALGNLVSWDGRLAATSRTLLRQPGVLAIEWAAGRRARHVPPIRLYLAFSLLYLVSGGSYQVAKEWLIEPDQIEQRDSRDRLVGWIPAEKVDTVDAYLHSMVALGSRWMFVLMPLGGFGLYVLYGLRRKSYPAHFVLAIHVFTVVILGLAIRRFVQLAVVLVPPHQRLSEVSDPINNLLVGIVFVVGYLYAAASIRRFYGVGWGKGLLSAPAVTVAPIVAWFGLLMVGMFGILAWPW